MKKPICALLACSTLIWCIGSMSNTVQAAEVTQSSNIASEICGDVNVDKIITVFDVILLQKWILGIDIGDLPNWKSADLDGNETIDLNTLLGESAEVDQIVLTEFQLKLSDTNYNGLVELRDVVAINRKTHGLPVNP